MSTASPIKKPLIIFGSARTNGNTAEAIKNVTNELPMQIPIINLNENHVNPFSYQHDQHDDFFNIINQLIKHDLILLASPVYWYSISAQLKCFIDRLSDLLIVNKPLGRALRGKHIAVIASYNNYPRGYDGFEKPIINMANYLGMNYLCTYFHYSGENPQGAKQSHVSLQDFLKKISI